MYISRMISHRMPSWNLRVVKCTCSGKVVLDLDSAHDACSAASSATSSAKSDNFWSPRSRKLDFSTRNSSSRPSCTLDSSLPHSNEHHSPHRALFICTTRDSHPSSWLKRWTSTVRPPLPPIRTPMSLTAFLRAPRPVPQRLQGRNQESIPQSRSILTSGQSPRIRTRGGGYQIQVDIAGVRNSLR